MAIKKFIAYIMCGIPGSGKTTFIKNKLTNLPVVSRDVIRAEIGLSKSADDKVVCSREDEEHVTNIEYEMINSLCRDKKSFVIDDTNTGKYRTRLIDELRKYPDCKIVGINLKTPLDVCIERRKNDIPEDIMRQIYYKCRWIDGNEVDKIYNFGE